MHVYIYIYIEYYKYIYIYWILYMYFKLGLVPGQLPNQPLPAQHKASQLLLQPHGASSALPRILTCWSLQCFSTSKTCLLLLFYLWSQHLDGESLSVSNMFNVLGANSDMSEAWAKHKSCAAAKSAAVADCAAGLMSSWLHVRSEEALEVFVGHWPITRVFSSPRLGWKLYKKSQQIWG